MRISPAGATSVKLLTRDGRDAVYPTVNEPPKEKPMRCAVDHCK